MFKEYDETAGVSTILAGATANEEPDTYGAKLKNELVLFYLFWIR